MAATGRLVRVARRAIKPAWPERFEVDGLFRAGSQRAVTFRTEDRVTILSGPNGVGKTRLLVILRAALALDAGALAAEPFESVRLSLSGGRQLAIQRSVDTGGGSVSLNALRGDKVLGTANVEVVEDPTASLILPDWVQRVDEDTWEDARDGELMSLDDLFSRFPSRPTGRAPGRRQWQVVEIHGDDPAQMRRELGLGATPTFVETKRLDVQVAGIRPTRFSRMSRQERIYDYVEQIQQQVQRARSEYSRISQSVDSSFAARALDSKEDPPSVGELRENFAELLELHGELLATGLAGESPGILMRSGALSKAERRMVAVFLEDWRAKLQPLLPINEKLKMLQEVVGSKLYDKRLRLDENGRLHVETTSGWEVPVEKLSSGEQHLLALFAMLIFTASIHSVVLVDEPEISLHAEWKHAFLDDIRRVADSSDLHFVLATHSTGIINGQWDLVEELEPA